MELRLLLRRGAVIAAANWPVVAIQFVAEATFKALLAVQLIGAAILVAWLLGGSLTDLLQGSLRDRFSAIAGALMADPVALTAFVTAFGVVLVGGSVLMFFIKGGTVDVLLAAGEAAGSIEREPLRAETLGRAGRFTLQRFTIGCTRLFRRYLALGLSLMFVYVVSAGAYLALVIYGYRVATSEYLVLRWTFIAASSAGVLVAWITIVNLLYLLLQIAIAVDGVGLWQGSRAVARFIRAEFRDLVRVFAVVITIVVVATLVSALALSGFGLIAFVPLVGLAVFPLQLVALLVRELIFAYVEITAVSVYVTLYKGHAMRRTAASRPRVARPFERPA
ncbi:MAG: hypothetical protein WBD07_06700 [Vicinamibacterales bacterium]